MVSRRSFNKGLVALALSGLSRHLMADNNLLTDLMIEPDKGYGALITDPNGMIDLPSGFSYEVISAHGQHMQDGLSVPDRADGMGCFAMDDERVVLIRNHELSPPKADAQQGPKLTQEKLTLAYDTNLSHYPLPGGTSNLIYNLKTRELEREFMSLIGTIRNCSGGITPWNTWLSCEESVLTRASGMTKDHGYVFEIPANARTMIQATPLKDMGRFNHEAACVDPTTNIVYLTEDRHDSLFYRFLPNQPGKLSAGGKLQALAVVDNEQFDTRNWDATQMQLGKNYAAMWINLDDVESPNDDLRLRGYEKGAARFARGEGIHWAENEMYFCCTNGGKERVGQIMKYRPSLYEGRRLETEYPGQLSLFVESPNKQTFNYGDNICVMPNDHLLVCEDQYSDQVNNKLKGITPQGKIYDFARIRWQTEPAGACFSPDGSVLFVNLYSPTRTLAIRGPWQTFSA